MQTERTCYEKCFSAAAVTTAESIIGDSVTSFIRFTAFVNTSCCYWLVEHCSPYTQNYSKCHNSTWPALRMWETNMRTTTQYALHDIWDQISWHVQFSCLYGKWYTIPMGMKETNFGFHYSTVWSYVYSPTGPFAMLEPRDRVYVDQERRET